MSPGRASAPGLTGWHIWLCAREAVLQSLPAADSNLRSCINATVVGSVRDAEECALTRSDPLPKTPRQGRAGRARPRPGRGRTWPGKPTGAVGRTLPGTHTEWGEQAQEAAAGACGHPWEQR